MDAICVQQQFVAEPTRLSLFDRFRGALEDLGAAPAMTELATAAFIGAYLRFLAPEWSESTSGWINNEKPFNTDLANPIEGLDYSYLDSDT